MGASTWVSEQFVLDTSIDHDDESVVARRISRTLSSHDHDLTIMQHDDRNADGKILLRVFASTEEHRDEVVKQLSEPLEETAS